MALLYDSVLERVPHRHCGFTLPKSDFAKASSGHRPLRGGPRRRFIEGGRLRVYFRYDRSLLDILFKAAASAVQVVLGTGAQIPALILTVQTAGEALNFNPHLHGLLAEGTFDAAGNFAPFTAIDTERMAERFRDHVLAELVTRGLITDEVPAQIVTSDSYIDFPIHDCAVARPDELPSGNSLLTLID
jgi:hypothetical protein